VSELCTRMAIINRGRILLEAEPMQAMAGIRGRIWRRVVARDELAAVQRDHGVISTTLLGGRTVVHVYADGSPGAGFEPTEPDLTDVYFSAMAGHIGNLGTQSRPAAAA
jgi:ABC-2 type transport system ATP-binding protein